MSTMRMTSPTDASTADLQAPLTIRLAGAADAAALERLAGRDSASLPHGPLLLAEVDGQIRAAVAIAGDGAVADPFHRTGELLALLMTRADQIRRERVRGLRVVAATPAGGAAARAAQPSGWRSVGLRLAAASSRRRTGVV